MKIINNILKFVGPLLITALLSTAVHAETVTYYINDVVGSPVAAMDQSGRLLWRESYNPFGESRENPSQNQNDIGFTGHQKDDATGLTYMQARYYDPVVGRFYGNDPVETESHLVNGNIQGFSRFAYANNNPYKYIDPDGKSPKAFARLSKVFFRPSTGNPKLNKAIELVDAGWSVADALAHTGADIQFEGGASLENVLGKEGNSSGGRRGKKSTKAGKRLAIENNKKLFGKPTCTNCGVQTSETTKRIKGSKVAKTETQVDHTEAKAKGGVGPSAKDQSNANVKCFVCNNIKSDN